MATTVCLGADTIAYPEGGGHFWQSLNWALGLRALGCQIVWLEAIEPRTPLDQVRMWITVLKRRLNRYGLQNCLALCSTTGERLAASTEKGCLDLESAMEAELLLDLRYDLNVNIVRCFRRSAIVDHDPGILQHYLARGDQKLAPHDVYFSIGETVGTSGAKFPAAGIRWHYTPPCVATEWWPPVRVADGPFTTVSHWYMNDWIVENDGSFYPNDKRTGFLPFLNLPSRTCHPLELALALAGDEAERSMLQERGWCVREAHEIASEPEDFQRYVQKSRGEFSCAKPSCVHMQNAWISDRTLCYLASGKPAIVQHTGPSQFLPDAAGLFRFRNFDEAVRYIEASVVDYERHCKLARALAEEYFDAKKVVGKVLERSLT